MSAFERYDLDAFAALLQADVVQSMPPYTLWLQGRDVLRAWMAGRGAGCQGSRLLPVEACASAAFAQYRAAPQGGHRAWALVLVEAREERVSRLTYFLETEAFFPRFGLPLTPR